MTGNFQDSVYDGAWSSTPLSTSAANTKLQNGEWILLKKTFTMPAKENVTGGRFNDNLYFEIALQGSNHIDGAYYFDGFGLVEGSATPKWADTGANAAYLSPVCFTDNKTGYKLLENEQIALNDSDKGVAREIAFSPVTTGTLTNLSANVLINGLNLSVSNIANNKITLTLPSNANTTYTPAETIVRVTGKLDNVLFVRNIYIGYELVSTITDVNNNPVSNLQIEYFKPQNLKLSVGAVSVADKKLRILASDISKANVDERTISSEKIYRLMAMSNPATTDSAVIEKVVNLSNGRTQIIRNTITTKKAVIYNDGTKDRYG
jgi:hypothetical protein